MDFKNHISGGNSGSGRSSYERLNIIYHKFDKKVHIQICYIFKGNSYSGKLYKNSTNYISEWETNNTVV